MADIIELKPVNKVQNIINKFCYCIGMLPSSYKTSMTYEEQLIAIGHYLEETVIPALNNNAEAVLELQNLYVELKNYVDNYFDNLNVQNEINNKLDEMSKDGSLGTLIQNYVNPLLDEFQNDVNTDISNINQKVNDITSGTPIAPYSTIEELKQANPNSGIYLVTSNGHIYYWNKTEQTTEDLGVYNGLNIYQGNIIELGYTQFLNCKNDGYYSFKTADVDLITDKPENLTKAGVLRVEFRAASGTGGACFQQIQDLDGNIWFRYDNNDFVQILDTSILNNQMLFQGNLYLLNYTQFAQCVKPGYYAFSQTYLTSITDKPQNLKNAGIIRVEIASNTNNYSQTIIDLYGNMWYRSNLENDFKEILSPNGNYTFRGNMQSLNITKFSDCLENGYYNFITSYVNSITDKPENLTRAGVLRVEAPQDGGSTMQTIQDVIGNIWFRYVGSNPEWTQIFNVDNPSPSPSSSSARWCAMGDSITEGYYSLTNEEGQGDYALDKTKGWINYVANLNGYTLTNEGEGGTGYVNTKNERPNAVDKAKEIDFTNFDFVTLAYGINDWKYNQNLGTFNDDVETGGTLYSNMRKTIEYIQSENPNIKIIVITPFNVCNVGEYASNWGLGYEFSNSKTLEDTFNAIVKVCNYYDIEYIDMTHYSLINRQNIQSLLLDGVHPTLEAHKHLGYELSKKINF